MAVHTSSRRLGASLRGDVRAAVVAPVAPAVPLTFSQRFELAVRRRRLQRLQSRLVTAGWLGASALLLYLAGAGFLGLR